MTENAEQAVEKGVRERLEAAAEGLLFISESESPFEFEELPGDAPAELTPDAVRAALGEPDGTPVAELTLDRFLAGHVEEADPADPVAQENAGRFRALKQALTESLADVRVFRVGDAQVRYHALGRTPAGRIAGLAASALET
ncbi:MAG TPA: nuclease A inhibitor family protein [Longimicrobiaceae bacterium]|nr:nuclease A inhibitor family protein [Longimicrobiaceae bacterium]